MDDKRHREATGVPSDLILGNLSALAASGAAIALRVPLIPGINDALCDLESAAAVAAACGGAIRKVHILPYHSAAAGKYALRGEAYAMGDAAPPTDEAARAAAAVFERAGMRATIGG